MVERTMTDTPNEREKKKADALALGHASKQVLAQHRCIDCVQPISHGDFALYTAFPFDSRIIRLTCELMQVKEQLCSLTQVQANLGHCLQIFNGWFLRSFLIVLWKIVLWKASVSRQRVHMLISKAALRLFTHGILKMGQNIAWVAEPLKSDFPCIGTLYLQCIHTAVSTLNFHVSHGTLHPDAISSSLWSLWCLS